MDHRPNPLAALDGLRSWKEERFNLIQFAETPTIPVREEPLEFIGIHMEFIKQIQ